MPQEIERKFLVEDPERLLAGATAQFELCQGYLSVDPRATVRVRLRGDAAWLTIKGASDASGRSRAEYEYPIPTQDARAMLDTLCAHPPLRKTRHLVPHDGLTWEVDVFHGRHAGLVLAEVELPTPDHPITLPPGVGEEVTGQVAYYNSVLASPPGPLSRRPGEGGA